MINPPELILKTIWIGLFVILLHISSLAQERKVYFHNSSGDTPQSSVSAVVQDNFGFLWVGSRYGLHRYDGLEFEELRIDSTRSLGMVNDVIVDHSGRLWIATNGNGVFIYDYSTDAAHSLPRPNKLCGPPVRWVNSLFEDDENRIWIGTTQGLYLFDSDQNCLSYYVHDPEDYTSISSNNITCTGADEDGQIWVGTWDGGINLLNEKTERFTRFNATNTESLNLNTIRCFERSAAGKFYVGTDEGALEVKYVEGDYVFQALLPQEQINQYDLDEMRVLAIECDAENGIWLGTENEGLLNINPEAQSVDHFLNDPNNERSLCSNSIWSLLLDDRGVLWIGTFHKGLCKLDPFEQKFPPPFRSSTLPNSLNSNIVSSFSEDSDGGIWIGTEGGGLNYFSPEKDTFKHFTRNSDDTGSLSNNYVIDVLCDSKGRIWAGNWSGGLNLKRPGSDTFEHFIHDPDNENSPGNNDIIALCEDREGQIWMSCFGVGVDRLDPEKMEFTHYSVNQEEEFYIPTKLVRGIIEDSAGRIWLSTDSEGLFCMQLNESDEIISFSTFNTKNGKIPSNFTTDILEDDKGRLWIGTEGSGLLMWETKKGIVKSLTIKDGLSGNFIYAIEKVGPELWLSTNRGLSSYNTESGVIHTYGEQDGLQSSRFYPRSSLKSSDNMFYFGGISGFNRFSPATIVTNPNPPRVYISGFALMEKDVPSVNNAKKDADIILKDQIKLSHRENDFRLKVSALNFSESEKNQYAYKLNKYDENWRYTSNPGEIYYVNVPHGKYQFEVKASNNDGIWSESADKLEIIILPPWYQTWWAYLSYTLVIIAILILGAWAIIRNERLKSQLELEHLQLEQSKELSKIRLKYFTDISHEFRTPLTLIISPLQSLLKQPLNERVKSQLEMMLRNAKRLLQLINQILDLSKIESGNLKLQVEKHDLSAFLKYVGLSFFSYADRSYIDLKIDLPKDPAMAYFDRSKMEQVIVNLLSNAIKNTPKFGKVKLRLRSKNNHFIVGVSDSGPGIPENEQALIFERFFQAENSPKNTGSGIGLAIVKEIVELHKGQVKLKDQNGEGAKFEIILKKGYDHFDADEVLSLKEMKAEEEVGDIFLPEVGTSALPLSDREIENNSKPLILVAEDHKDIRDYLVDLLRKNYRLLECSDGKEALESARESIPDLIITDVMMPEMDGYELVEKLKYDERTSHIPIIMLTAKASPESETKGFELGAIQFVTKPFDPTLFAMQIRNTLNNLRAYKHHLLETTIVSVSPQQNQSSSKKEEQFLKKASQIIEANLSNTTFQVTDLSKELNMSKAQLYRKMKGVTGCSTNEFIRSYRLKRAAQLLRSGDISVSETTYQVGFTDLQYFRKCFVKQYGVTPSEYVDSQKTKV